MTDMAWLGLVWRGSAGPGMAGAARLVMAGHGTVRQGRRGMVWLGRARRSSARHGRSGLARYGLAALGRARQGRHV